MSSAGPQPDDAAVARELEGLSRAGLPLPEGLRAAAEELPRRSRQLRRVFLALADRLEQGATLPEAIESPEVDAPNSLRALVHAGAESGRLGEFIARFLRARSVGSALRRRFALLLAYPLVVAVLALILLIFASRWCLAPFETIFDDFSLDLPSTTLGVLALGRVMSQSGWEITFGTIGLIGAWIAFARWTSPARGRRWLVSLPGYGPFADALRLSEFARYAAVVVDAGVPLPSGLRMAAEATGDADLVQIINQVSDDLAGGSPLSMALGEAPRLHPVFAEIVGGADGHGRPLAPALETAADLFEEIARARADALGAAKNLFIILIAVSAIGFTIFALFLPLTMLITRLSG
jgi:type II secretory pathway component PulF